MRSYLWPTSSLGSMDSPSVTDHGPLSYSFSTSPSKSMLHQSLSFPFANAVQDDSDIALSTSCAILEEADIASSVWRVRDDEQQPRQEQSWPLDHGPLALDASNLCMVLVLSPSPSHWISLCFFCMTAKASFAHCSSSSFNSSKICNTFGIGLLLVTTIFENRLGKLRLYCQDVRYETNRSGHVHQPMNIGTIASHNTMANSGFITSREAVRPFNVGTTVFALRHKLRCATRTDPPTTQRRPRPLRTAT